MSKVTLLLVRICPQNTSVDCGACENTILPLSIPNPVEGLELSCGCCITPLTERTN